jgi:hypothetical protein
MPKRLLPVLILTLLFFPFSKVSAATCNVEVGPGKKHNTITKGIGAASSGQTVCVYYDTYNETVNINESGLTLLGISNSQGKKPVIDGKYNIPNGADATKGLCPGKVKGRDGNLYTCKAGNYAGIVEIKRNNVKISNFEITGSLGRGVLGEGISDVTIDNLYIHDTRKHGISIQSSNGVNVLNTTILRAQSFAQFDRTASVLNWGSALQTRLSKNVLIDSVVVGETWGEGINPLFSENVIVKNSVAYDNWRLNIYVDNILKGLFENNLSYHTNSRPAGMVKSAGMVLRVENPYSGNEGSGGKVNKDIVIRNNYFVNNLVGIVIGRQGDKVNENIQIYNNTIVNPDGNAFQFNNSGKDSGFVRANILVGGGISAAGTGINIRDNLNSDPGLVNSSAKMTPGQTDVSNYKLKAESSAINTGPKISGLTKDYFGCNRDGSPDYGAHEYNGTNCDRGNGANPTPTQSEPTPPTPSPTLKYDPKFDHNDDNKVNIQDVIEVIRFIFG